MQVSVCPEGDPVVLFFTILFQLKMNENTFMNDSECFPDSKTEFSGGCFKENLNAVINRNVHKNYMSKRTFNNSNHKKYLSLVPHS